MTAKRGRPRKTEQPDQEPTAAKEPNTLPNGYAVEQVEGRFIIRQSGNVVHVENSQEGVDQYLKMVTGQ